MDPNSKKPTVKRHFWDNQGSLIMGDVVDNTKKKSVRSKCGIVVVQENVML